MRDTDAGQSSVVLNALRTVDVCPSPARSSSRRLTPHPAQPFIEDALFA